MLLEDVKKVAEKLTGIARPMPKQAVARVKTRKANAWRFADDGLVPNNPKWPAIHYRGAVNLKGASDPAAVVEVLFAAHGWMESWRDAVYDYLHYHSNQHEVLGFVRGHAMLRLGGARGRNVKVKAGDVVILPAGTGHQRLSMSDDLLVVGAYPRKGGYDMCHPSKPDHDRAAVSAANVPKPKADPVYGKGGPLMRLWR
ncbi:MAG: cupin domain-containing protein [Alphaproteobacteria bacterium]|nr:cupin domain-containing protein [Alphaproteobacteria bacterium]